MSADPRIEARIQLADVQEQLYRYLSVEPHQRRSNRAAGEIARIRQDADAWAARHITHTPPWASRHDAELQLTFLATRMLAYSGSRDAAHRAAVLDDARASCLILLVSYDRHDRAMLRMLQSLRRRRRQRPGSGRNSPAVATATATEHEDDLDQAAAAAGEMASAGCLADLVGAFPAVAFFKLAQHVLWSSSSSPAEPSSPVDGAPSDYELLQAVYTCAAEVNGRAQSQNRAVQVERTFGKVLELIRLLRHGTTPLDLSPATYDITGPSSQARTPTTAGFTSVPPEFTDAAVLSGTDTSWDFLTSQFSDAILTQIDVGDGPRKRPRTSDVDFCVDDDLYASFLPSLA